MQFTFLILTTQIACSKKPGPVYRHDVFVSGADGYHTYRIPSLLITQRGTLLAFCEGRKMGSGDTGNIDLLLKRSEDNGKTWSTAQLIWDAGDDVCGNPCPVQDRATGTIWLLVTWNRGADTERQIIRGESEETRRVFALQSVDEGQSWSTPTDITHVVKDSTWGWYATGPGIGIQIQQGQYQNRLVIPCDHSYNDPDGTVQDGPFEYGSHIIYSDDHGKSWHLGGVIRPKVNECQVVEVDDGHGTLLMNMRAYRGKNLRAQSFSRDGGMTWSEIEDVADLIEPVCQASMVRYSWKEQGASRLLFSNPASLKREKLSVKMSLDEGKTWPYAKELHAGPAAYCCLGVLRDGQVACLYEGGENNPYERITFVKFQISWLESITNE